jgi:hypothetical protein
LLLICIHLCELYYFPPHRAAKILTEMRSMFGSNDCQLLCINSSPHGVIERLENPWAPYVSYFTEVICFVVTSYLGDDILWFFIIV